MFQTVYDMFLQYFRNDENIWTGFLQGGAISIASKSLLSIYYIPQTLLCSSDKQ